MSCEEWDATYGKVYSACIAQGALTCMVGHIMQPAYSKRLNPALSDGDILPASLSSEIINGLLRGKLGFNGLVVTDATTMAGYTTAMSRRLAVPTSIAAGCDMFLFCRNTQEDYGYMLDGVRNGIITQQRLDEAVTRILATKAALGLHKPRAPLSVEAAQSVVGCEEHHRWARNVRTRPSRWSRKSRACSPSRRGAISASSAILSRQQAATASTGSSPAPARRSLMA